MDAVSVAHLFSNADGSDDAVDYLRAEGLLDDLAGGTSDDERIPPCYPDLARLHLSARTRKALTVLEFGIGYSTLVLADALGKNRRDWESLAQKPAIRCATPFELHSVDTSPVWIERTQAMFPERLADVVTFHHSSVSAGSFGDRACHYYDELPDVVPDFIYLDGPDPSTVIGGIAGLSWGSPDRVVMAADLLRMEPHLLPGALVVVDGRTANARFLAAHFYRVWEGARHPDGDVTVFELQESPLGRINASTLEYCLGARGRDFPDPFGD